MLVLHWQREILLKKYAAIRNFRMKREAEQEALAACKTNSANCTITFSACEK